VTSLTLPGHMAPARVPNSRPESAFLRTLMAPLMEDAQSEVELALKVAYAVEHGLTQDEIAAKLGVPRGEVGAAAKRVKRIREQLERGG
jgi:DNA-directed RNA polymerase specialized sigma24 family protein